MTDHTAVAAHYTRDDLLSAILTGIQQLGKTVATVSIEDLAPVDEFHIGGALATRAFLDQVAIAGDDHVLDIGCGIGGASRFAADAYGCRVTGIDLTPRYVATGEALCSWLGLDSRVELILGNALAMDFAPESFDQAFMLHVGMNIADKATLAGQVWRALKPGGVFGIYDVMRTGSEELVFPVPWASVPGTSVVSSPDEYREALAAAGFVVESERDRRDFAIEFFQRLRAGEGNRGPPPLGLHLLMGPDAPLKIANMIDNIARGTVSPVEVIARKTG